MFSFDSIFDWIVFFRQYIYELTLIKLFYLVYKNPKELIALESVVNVRCYELTALYFCALFASKGCGNYRVKPCQSLCKGKTITIIKIILEFSTVSNENSMICNILIKLLLLVYRNHS